MATELEVDVARTGRFCGMGNRTVELTRGVLEQLAESLNLAAFRPKVWAGHTTELRSDTPSLGDVVGLRVIGERLMAKLRLTDEGSRRMREGNYTERSIELDFVGGKAKFLGLALLGARRPAISGLTPFYLTSPAPESPGMILLAAGDDGEENESPDLKAALAADPSAAVVYRTAKRLERREGISFAEAVGRVSREAEYPADPSGVPPGCEPISFAAAEEIKKRSLSSGISFAAALGELRREGNETVQRYLATF